MKDSTFHPLKKEDVKKCAMILLTAFWISLFISAYNLIIALLLLNIASGYVASLIARKKQRSKTFWFFIGLIIGLISIGLISALKSK